MAKKKIGLALAGGGAKGAYQVGVYKAMLDSRIKISGVVGTSIGAFNAAMIAANDIDKLEYFWTHDDIGKLMGFLESMDIDKKNYSAHIKQISIPITSIIANKGLTMEPLKNRITEIIDEKSLRESDIDFGLVTFRVKDKKRIYLFKDEIKENKISEYVAASCYLPVFHYKKLEEDSYYLDGGFVDNLPYNMLDKQGYSKIYAVNLRSIGLIQKNKVDSEVVIIKPSRPLGHLLNTNRYKIKENIKLGYYDGLKVFKNLDGNKYLFSRKPDWIYDFLVRKISVSLKSRAQVYFLTRNNKDLVLNSIEYVLRKEGKKYYNIYNPLKEIRRIKKIKSSKKYSLPYLFIKKLKMF